MFLGRSPGTRVMLIQKHCAFDGCWQATGVVFAEQAIAIAGDQAIAQIAHWPWNDPEQTAEQFPAATQCHQNPTDGGGSDKRHAIANEDQCVETVADLLVQDSASRDSLQRSESQTVLRISRQQPVHGVVTQPADAVEKDNGVIDVLIV